MRILVQEMKMDNWPDGYSYDIREQVDSTLDEARRIAPGLSGPVWLLAMEQTSGRGRHGRVWRDPPGNFASALILRPKVPLEQVALHSFVAALALYDAFVAVSVPSEKVSLKWPNDVLLNGGKVAGILLESTGAGRGVSYLAIGIGVNLINTPRIEDLEPGALHPVSLSGETGIHISPKAFLSALAIAFARYESLFVASGFEPIREIWLSRAARLGETIVARTPKRRISGIFETIDRTGSLIIATENGRESIAAAEIYF